MNEKYDAIVVGARCAGAPMAMLLARRGHRVLVVDRATFPSDTISTLVLHPHAVSALARWGLLEQLVASGCPPIHTYVYDFGPFVIEGSPGVKDSPVAYAPRRTVLDKILVDAAAASGAEVLEGFSVDRLLMDGDRVIGIEGRSSMGEEVRAHASVVIGADGRHSMVARAVKPERYHERPILQVGYYAFWSGLPMNGRFEIYLRGRRGVVAIPTNDGETLVLTGWSHSEFHANKRDLEGSYARTLELVPQLADRLRSAKRETRLVGGGVPNFFHKPYGPGWVLAGDAGLCEDPVTAQGIVSAFRDAERYSAALDAVFRGTRSFEEVMSACQRERDEHALPMYELTCQFASMDPPPPETQRLLAAVAKDRSAMDAFVKVNAGLIPVAEFFAPANIEAIMAKGPPA